MGFVAIVTGTHIEKTGNYPSLIIHFYSEIYTIFSQPICFSRFHIRNTIHTLKYYIFSFSGEVSAGKSTFINNLIGIDLLPTDFTHCTSVICRIRNSFKSENRLELISEVNKSVVKDVLLSSEAHAKRTLKKYIDKESQVCQAPSRNYKYVDIYWTIPFLQVCISNSNITWYLPY